MHGIPFVFLNSYSTICCIEICMCTSRFHLLFLCVHFICGNPNHMVGSGAKGKRHHIPFPRKKTAYPFVHSKLQYLFMHLNFSMVAWCSSVLQIYFFFFRSIDNRSSVWNQRQTIQHGKVGQPLTHWVHSTATLKSFETVILNVDHEHPIMYFQIFKNYNKTFRNWWTSILQFKNDQLIQILLPSK